MWDKVSTTEVLGWIDEGSGEGYSYIYFFIICRGNYSFFLFVFDSINKEDILVFFKCNLSYYLPEFEELFLFSSSFYFKNWSFLTF